MNPQYEAALRVQRHMIDSRVRLLEAWLRDPTSKADQAIDRAELDIHQRITKMLARIIAKERAS